MAQRSYGCIPSVPDSRDIHYQALRLAPLPTTVDLRIYCSPVRDQGSLGACTGFAAAAGLREFLLNRTGAPFVPLSPLFLYYEERSLENSIDQDAGAQPRDAMRVLTNIGCATEADDPYDPANFAKPFSPAALSAAGQYKIRAFHRLRSLYDVQVCLAEGRGILLGMTVFQSFESDAVTQTGKLPLPQPGEPLIGSHAVFCAGYQADPGAAGGGYLIVKNSWGADWGDKGYFYMPYAYVRPDWLHDMWTAVV